MHILEEIDRSSMRKEASEKKIPILELLFQKLEGSKKERPTLLAVCPNSEIVLKAALRAAKRANAPILFAATLNQVDIDRGYTGWTPKDLIRKIKEESYRIDYEGPTIVGIDHGGPWAKDRQTIERWGLAKSMDWIKKSFEAAIEAGYDMIHIDPTIDIFNKIEIATVVERTIELLSHCEEFIKTKDFKPISYEVGTEEVHGGLVDMKIFKEFLDRLKNGLVSRGLNKTWPIFIVAKVGTDLHTTTFDPEVSRVAGEIVKPYGSYIKGHYTDFVENPRDYTKSSIGAANVGPEFTMAEYDSLAKLCIIEEDLYRKDCIGLRSEFMNSLKKAVIASGRWMKWLQKGEKDLDSISKERKDWIIKTSARYVWADFEVKCSLNMLFKNLGSNGIDGEGIVLSSIEKAIDKYYREFGLLDLDCKLRD